MKPTLLMTLLVTGALLALGSEALACPYCAGRDDGGMSATLIVGAMMVVPFAVVGVLWPIVTREEDRELTHPQDGEDSTCE